MATSNAKGSRRIEMRMTSTYPHHPTPSNNTTVEVVTARLLQPTTRTSTSSRHQQQHNPRVQTVSSSMNRFNHVHPCIAKGGEARDLHNLARFHICSKNPSSMTTDYYAWPQFKKELNAHNPMEVLNPAPIGYEAIQKNSVSTMLKCYKLIRLLVYPHCIPVPSSLLRSTQSPQSC